MCGIFGYIGPEDSAVICLKGLERLEYRGYDSAGLCGIHAGQLKVWKEVGKIRALEQAWTAEPLPLSLAIAHTRWATHGEPTRDNAHPHFDQDLRVAVVHNGIIENHRVLREMLESFGVKFKSQTDTEVIAQLIAHYYKGDLAAATQEALSLMQGFWELPSSIKTILTKSLQLLAKIRLRSPSTQRQMKPISPPIRTRSIALTSTSYS